MTEKIEVEWIATIAGSLQAIEKLNNRLDRQEKQLQKIGDTSTKAATAAVGSFNKLEQELKENEAVLKRLTIGSKEFELQRQKVEALRKSLKGAKSELDGVKPKAETWGMVGKSMMGAAASAGVLFAALVKVADAQRQVVSGAADDVVAIDTLARRLQIQAGLTDPERVVQSGQVIEQASAAGVAAETGFQAATQLAGSGFGDSVNNGTLATILSTIQASSFTGSPEQLVSAFSEALNAYGLQKTNANLETVAVASQSLFKQTDFQLTELADFAKSAAVFQSANMTLAESMAGFTALREVLPASEAGVGLRNFVAKLQAGDITKENKDNMKRIGVKAEQVDFVGESLKDVLTTIKTATDKMPEEKRNAALGKMFGTENVNSAKLLMKSVDRIAELEKSQADKKTFERDRDTAAGGFQADRNRLRNQEMVERMPIAAGLVAKDMELKRRDQKDKALVEKVTIEKGALAGSITGLVTATSSTVDAVAGQGAFDKANTLAARGVNPAILLMDMFRKTNDDTLAEQKKQTAILEKMAMKTERPAVVPGRPKEAPLPVITVP